MRRQFLKERGTHSSAKELARGYYVKWKALHRDKSRAMDRTKVRPAYLNEGDLSYNRRAFG